MDTADIQGKLLAYFNQLSPEARDRLLASAPAQETQPQPASGSGNAQPGQTLPTKAPPPVVTGQAQAQSPESGSTPNPAPDASASSLLADELADMKKSASTRRGQKAKALTRDWDFIDPAQGLSWSPDQIRRAHGDGRVIPSLVFKKTEAETSPSAQPGPLPSVSETRPAWADIQEEEALNTPLPISSSDEDSPVIEEVIGFGGVPIAMPKIVSPWPPKQPKAPAPAESQVPPAPPAKSTPPSPEQSLPSQPTSKAPPEPEARPSASPTKPNPRMTMVYEGRTWHNFWGQDPPANAISVDWDSFWFTLEEEPMAAQPKGPPSCPPPAQPPQQAQESHQPPGTKAPPPPMPQEPEPAHKKIKCSVFGADGWILRKDHLLDDQNLQVGTTFCSNPDRHIRKRAFDLLVPSLPHTPTRLLARNGTLLGLFIRTGLHAAHPAKLGQPISSRGCIPIAHVLHPGFASTALCAAAPRRSLDRRPRRPGSTQLHPTRPQSGASSAKQLRLPADPRRKAGHHKVSSELYGRDDTIDSPWGTGLGGPQCFHRLEAHSPNSPRGTSPHHRAQLSGAAGPCAQIDDNQSHAAHHSQIHVRA